MFGGIVKLTLLLKCFLLEWDSIMWDVTNKKLHFCTRWKRRKVGIIVFQNGWRFQNSFVTINFKDCSTTKSLWNEIFSMSFINSIFGYSSSSIHKKGSPLRFKTPQQCCKCISIQVWVTVRPPYPSFETTSSHDYCSHPHLLLLQSIYGPEFFSIDKKYFSYQNYGTRVFKLRGKKIYLQSNVILYAFKPYLRI